jgi:hypothetical protein
MFFGTNTNFGISAGQDVSGIPSVTVGYRRQEGVLMPLVANQKDDGTGRPTPCAVYPAASGVIRPGELPPCFLVGKHEGAIDTYSVLASFGAEFTANGANATAGGGLAQFFATGLAAQALAIRGGPALVAVGDAAKAQTETNVTGALAGLFNDPEIVSNARTQLAAADALRSTLVEYLQAHTTNDGFAAELVLVEQAAGAAGIFSGWCTGKTKDECLALLNSPMGAAQVGLHGGFDKAVQERKKARELP